MKNTTVTKKPAASKAAKPAKKTTSGRSGAPKKGLPEVRKFTVTVAVRWVEITAKIHQEHADALAVRFGQDEAEMSLYLGRIFESYATSVDIYVDAFRHTGRRSPGWFDIRLDAGRPSLGRGKRQTKIRFSVKEWQWLQFLRDCETLDYTPAEVIRGAFSARATGAGMPGHRREGGRS
jgi:hypothetical protein